MLWFGLTVGVVLVGGAIAVAGYYMYHWDYIQTLLEKTPENFTPEPYTQTTKQWHEQLNNKTIQIALAITARHIDWAADRGYADTLVRLSSELYTHKDLNLGVDDCYLTAAESKWFVKVLRMQGFKVKCVRKGAVYQVKWCKCPKY